MPRLKEVAKNWLRSNPRAHEVVVPIIRLLRPARSDLLPGRPPNQAPIQVPIQVPGCQTFYMLDQGGRDQGGRDQIVRDVRRSGWASYEHPLPQVLAVVARLSRGAFWDVGANTGFYTLLALACGPRLRAEAFEPFPPAAEALAANLSINRSGRRATIVAKAAGAAPGQAQLWLPPADHGLIETSSSLNSDVKEVHSGSITVDVIRLDDHPIRDAEPSILKIDVESLEHVVMEGATRVFEQARPLVFLEVLPKAELAALERLRVAHRYTDVRLRPDGAVIGEPIDYDEAAWNHLLIPTEALPRWAAVAQSALD